MSKSRKGLLGGAVALIAVIGLVIGSQMRQRHRSAAEIVACDSLRELGAFVVLDAERVHVRSVDMRLPAAKQNVGEAMELVCDLPYLEVLQLGGTVVTDEHLKFITSNRSLMAVGLGQTEIGDAGMASLARLRNLQALYLTGTKVTPAGLDHLKRLAKLEILDLSKTGVASDDLATLPILKSLQHLLLRNVDLGDEAMLAIARQPSLSRLTIGGGNVSEQAMKQLKTAKPGLKIDN